MLRIDAICLTCVFVFSGSVTAFQKDTQDKGTVKYQGKTLAEWFDLLKNNKDAEVRQGTLVILDGIGPLEPTIIPAVVESLQTDKNEEVRAAAAQALGSMAPRAKESVAVQAAKALKKALVEDKSPEVQQAAAKALGGKMVKFAADTDAVVALGNALKSADAGLRAAAVTALKDFGADALEVLPQLLEAAKDPKLDLITRAYALQILANHNKNAGKMVPVLMDVLKEKDAHASLKQAAVNGLANYFRDAVPATGQLVDILKDDKAPVLLRQAAAAALSKIQPESAKVWPTIKSLMKEGNAFMRTQAIRLAAKLCKSEPELIPALIVRANDDNADAQIAAIQELGGLGPVAIDAVATLKVLVESSVRDTVREAAAAALKKIQTK